jgi:hypothetical protein
MRLYATFFQIFLNYWHVFYAKYSLQTNLNTNFSHSASHPMCCELTILTSSQMQPF